MIIYCKNASLRLDTYGYRTCLIGYNKESNEIAVMAANNRNEICFKNKFIELPDQADEIPMTETLTENIASVITHLRQGIYDYIIDTDTRIMVIGLPWRNPTSYSFMREMIYPESHIFNVSPTMQLVSDKEYKIRDV